MKNNNAIVAVLVLVVIVLVGWFTYKQGYFQRGYKAKASHVSGRFSAQQSIEKLMNKIKPTFITFMGRIVYVLVG